MGWWERLLDALLFHHASPPHHSFLSTQRCADAKPETLRAFGSEVLFNKSVYPHPPYGYDLAYLVGRTLLDACCIQLLPFGCLFAAGHGKPGLCMQMRFDTMSYI